jgi:DUF4097 and DUF4098 domain-containing protein YvlB
MTGLNGLSTAELKLEKGNINVSNSMAYKISADITNGDITIDKFTGIGVFKCEEETLC